MKLDVYCCLNVLFSLSLMSTFLADIAIYPIIFFLFAVLYFYASILSRGVDKVWRVPFLITLSLIALIIFAVLNTATIIFGQLAKMFTNMLFLAAALSHWNYALSTEKLRSSNWIWLQRVLEVVLFLSFIQALVAVFFGGLWLAPFHIESSEDAYLIQSVPIVWGGGNKNIWATKVVLIFIIYLYLLRMKIFRLGGTVFLVAAVAFPFLLVYTMSRTAQLAFMSFVLSLLVLWMYEKMRRKALLLIIPLLLMALLVAIKIARLDSVDFSLDSGRQGDGLKARLILWFMLLNYYWDASLYSKIFGSGLMYAKVLFEGSYSESNAHNVFLNMLIDFGILGLLLYIYALKLVFLSAGGRVANALILFSPLLVILNSQYVGYDNDLVVYFSLSYLALLLSADSRPGVTVNKMSS